MPKRRPRKRSHPNKPKHRRHKNPNNIFKSMPRKLKRRRKGSNGISYHLTGYSPEATNYNARYR